MTLQEVASKAEELREEANRIPSPTMGNYKVVLATYRRMLNDLLVLIRELAQDRLMQTPAVSIHVESPVTTEQ